MLAEHVRNNILEEIPSADGPYMTKEGLGVINVCYREDEPNKEGWGIYNVKNLLSLDRI